MVRAYFGAKKMILVERPTTHRGTLSFGRGCDGPSSKVYNQWLHYALRYILLRACASGYLP